MNLSVVAFSDLNKLVSINKLIFPNIDVINVYIEQDRQLQQPYFSLACTPGRYLELFLESEKQSNYDSLFLLNPFICPHNAPWIQLLSSIKNSPLSKTSITYISDLQDRPLGIIFNNFRDSIKKIDTFWLRFLSLIDSTQDIALLRKTTSENVSLLQLDIQFNYHDYWANGFYYFRYQNVYKLMTQHSLNFIRKYGTTRPKATAVIPHHAGDILFFLKAIKETKNVFTKILVSKDYVDIVKRELPSIQVKVINSDSLGRGTNKNNLSVAHQNLEFEYFYQVAYPLIEEDELFYFFRPYRQYSRANLHLIDQFKIAISNERPYFVQNNKQEITKNFNKKNKILLHFDGGWDLKIYPYNMQIELVSLLQAAGIEPIVLTDNAGNYPCPSEKFSNLSRLEELITDSDILIGMDSFPAHFSTHTLHHPTICLFSSTRPDNSNNYSSKIYKDLSLGLQCCPCDSTTICPVNKTTICSNFVNPKKVLNVVKDFYKNLFGTNHEKSNFYNLQR